MEERASSVKDPLRSTPLAPVLLLVRLLLALSSTISSSFCGCSFFTFLLNIFLWSFGVHVLIGDWLNRVNKAEQSVRDNEQLVKELEEQLMASKYQA